MPKRGERPRPEDGMSPLKQHNERRVSTEGDERCTSDVLGSIDAAQLEVPEHFVIDCGSHVD